MPFKFYSQDVGSFAEFSLTSVEEEELFPCANSTSFRNETCVASLHKNSHENRACMIRKVHLETYKESPLVPDFGFVVRFMTETQPCQNT